MPSSVSRRQFVQVASATVLAAACSDDPKKAADAAPDGTDGADATPDTADTAAPDAALETEIEATETTAEVADVPEVDSGPIVIGTFDPATVPEREQSEFLFAVQAGDATADGACLWTRYTGSGQLDLVVFENGSGVQSGRLYV